MAPVSAKLLADVGANTLQIYTYELVSVVSVKLQKILAPVSAKLLADVGASTLQIYTYELVSVVSVNLQNSGSSIR